MNKRNRFARLVFIVGVLFGRGHLWRQWIIGNINSFWLDYLILSNINTSKEIMFKVGQKPQLYILWEKELIFGLYHLLKSHGLIKNVYPLKEKWKKVGAYDTKIAGTADSKHSMFKCLVNTLYRYNQYKCNSRFLTKVNTYISGSKHGRFILNHKILSENESSRSWIDFTDTFFSKKSSILIQR